jgi:dTDP-4-amino-4,6-dideoxygalactose transaminase
MTIEPIKRSELRLRVPFNDLAAQWREVRHDVLSAFTTVFDHSTYSNGPEVEAFERALGDYLGVEHAIAVNSGTSALHLAMLAAGIGPGTEVILPAHTFVATAWGVVYTGAMPVLCDVEAATGNIDIASAERFVSPRTKAVIPVHLYGQPADMDAVGSFAERHNLVVIEDAAQAIGARWNDQPVGTIASLGCLSFYPGKNLGAAGEGGAVIPRDAQIAARLRQLRNHGQRDRYIHNEIGFNYRMDGLQGVVLRHKLKHLDRWSKRRRELAERYRTALAGLPIQVPSPVHGDHVWHLFVIRTALRDKLRRHLTDAGVETGLHYPVPLNRQPCFAHLRFDLNRYPHTERWASEGLSLPLFYGMSEAQVDYVVAKVGEFFRHA